jgi:xylulokinase
MAVIAIDLGTTSCKAAVFDGGQVLGAAYHHYPYGTPQDGWAEQDAEAVWRLVDNSVAEALASCHLKREIAAIAVSVQGDAIIPIDAAGQALAPAILGMDTRSHPEAADLQARFGRGYLYSATGMPCEPLNAITKIFWLKRNRPDLRAQLWKFVHYEDFLLMKLAGIPALDFTMASRTMAFDPEHKEWVAPILDFVGVTPAQLGNVTASGVPVGIIHQSLAQKWGISPKALVVAGGHDQCMAAVGAGVIEEELACYSMGTAEVISTCYDEPRRTAPMLNANYPCYCHAVKDRYFTITLNQSGGLSLEWFQKAVMELSPQRGEVCTASYAALLGALQVAPSPVLFLPHIVGSGTPACDHLSRGAFVGLSLNTSRADLFQAVVDALAFEARLNLETLQTLDIPISELRAVGGGARSRLVLELKATVLNRPISTLRNPEAALLGAALLAQVAVGQFPDLGAACRECVQIAETIEPQSQAQDAYDSAFDRFRQVYGTLRSYYHNWRPECQNTMNG